jgi:hypothetical protein
MSPNISKTLGICCLGYATLQGYARSVTAVSPEADFVRRNAAAVAQREEHSQALFGEKSSAISKLWAMANEYVAENHDEVTDINLLAINMAEQFLRVLPDDVQTPEFSVEPDGSISLDWIKSKDKIFSLSVGTNNRLAYAWMDAGDRGHAVVRFDGNIVPSRILEGIRGIIGYGNTSIRLA